MPLELVGALNKLAGTSGKGAAAAAESAVVRFANYPVHEYEQISSDTTLGDVNRIVGCSAHSITVTLPTAALEEGAWVTVKDESGGAGGVGQSITIATEGAETIDGADSVSLNENWEATTVYSDGSNWLVGSRFGGAL